MGKKEEQRSKSSEDRLTSDSNSVTMFMILTLSALFSYVLATKIATLGRSPTY
jgi:hypothetical protein